MIKNNKGNFFLGKVADFVTRKGWFFGHFMDDKLLRSNLVEVAWQDISNKKSSLKDKHFHKKSIEINIIISGWVKITINGKRVKVNRVDFFVIYPLTVVEDVEAGPNTELIVIKAPSIPGDKFLLSE